MDRKITIMSIPYLLKELWLLKRETDLTILVCRIVCFFWLNVQSFCPQSNIEKVIITAVEALL